MCSLLLQQNDPCPYIEDCRNSNNGTKCSKCENKYYLNESNEFRKILENDRKWISSSNGG